MNTVLDIANHPIMWIAAAICVGVVIWQAVLFAKKSWKTGLELGISKETMKASMKGAAITAIGPSIAVGTGVVALIMIIGAPLAWYRLSYVGALVYETLAASLAIEASGLKMGVDAFGGTELATICWVMTIGAFGFTIVAMLLADKVVLFQKKIAGNNVKLMGVISSCALMSSLGSLSTQYMTSLSPNLVAVLAGAISMAVFSTVANRKKLLWLKELSLFFSLLVGMVCALAVA